MAPLAIDLPETATLLSPSQLGCFLGCPARWFYRYVAQLPDTQGSALAIGKSLHAAMRENFGQKCETHRDLPLAGVLAIYRDAWCEEERVTAFEADEDPAELKAMGESLVTKYLEEAAPQIEPAEVELHVQGTLGGVDVHGYVDLLDVNGRIIDLKSAKATPSSIRPDYRLQVATYAQITPGATGVARLDTTVKLKREVKLVSQEFEINEADKLSTEVLYPLAQAGMRSGIYPPARNNYLCSRRYCSYASQCVKEYGGEVE